MTNEQLVRAAQLLKDEFGPSWETVAQVLGTEGLRKRAGKDLTSFIAFPERGEGGDNKWRGNCAPGVVESLIQYALECKRYYGKHTDKFTLLDPMSGSGTSQAAAESKGVNSILYDLNPAPPHGVGGWDALKDDVDDSADLIFLHPPYHSIIQYSGGVWGKPHPDDLSRCGTYDEFIEKLNFIIRKLFLALRRDGRLAILVGDVRSKGKFYSIQRDICRLGQMEAFLVKGQYNCVSDSRTYRKPFIPIVTEYVLLFHKDSVMTFLYSLPRECSVDLNKQDSKALTWHHLVRMTMEEHGGQAKLSELAEILRDHPKSQKNPHFQERIRATVYEHPQQYLSLGGGYYKLNYQCA